MVSPETCSSGPSSFMVIVGGSNGTSHLDELCPSRVLVCRSIRVRGALSESNCWLSTRSVSLVFLIRLRIYISWNSWTSNKSLMHDLKDLILDESIIWQANQMWENLSLKTPGLETRQPPIRCKLAWDYTYII